MTSLSNSLEIFPYFNPINGLRLCRSSSAPLSSNETAVFLAKVQNLSLGADKVPKEITCGKQSIFLREPQERSRLRSLLH